MSKDDKKIMGQALAEARLALGAGEFPVGCVLVVDGRVVVTVSEAEKMKISLPLDASTRGR